LYDFEELKHKLEASENKGFRKVFRPKDDELSG
jgi:hypothetical protein